MVLTTRPSWPRSSAAADGVDDTSESADTRDSATEDRDDTPERIAPEDSTSDAQDTSEPAAAEATATDDSDETPEDGERTPEPAEQQHDPRRRDGEPELSADIAFSDLDADARRELKSLSKAVAELVGKHLVAAGLLIDEDPELALAHARFARTRASRVAVVREAAGITAYHAGEWAEALGEFRAVRRMTGSQNHLPVMVDCERALGRPERALELAAEGTDLPSEVAVELKIVAAGARRDLGQVDAAVVALQGPDLDPKRRDPWSARLFYAYADNLEAAGRHDDAIRWFLNAADADLEDETDAAERATSLSASVSLLDDYDALLFDLDGTIYRGEDVVPGADRDASRRHTPRAQRSGSSPTTRLADPRGGKSSDSASGCGRCLRKSAPVRRPPRPCSPASCCPIQRYWWSARPRSCTRSRSGASPPPAPTATTSRPWSRA